MAGAAYVDLVQAGGYLLRYIHNPRRVDDIDLRLSRSLEQRPQAVDFPHVSPEIPHIFPVRPGLRRQNQPPDLAVRSLEHPDNGAAQMAGRAGHDIYLFHKGHPFPLTDTVLLLFLICIILEEAEPGKRQNGG